MSERMLSAQTCAQHTASAQQMPNFIMKLFKVYPTCIFSDSEKEMCQEVNALNGKMY